MNNTIFITTTMEIYKRQNLNFITMPDGRDSSVSFWISFEALNTEDETVQKFEKEVIGLSWNSTIASLKLQAIDTADAIILKLNQDHQQKLLEDAVEHIKENLPNITVVDGNDTPTE